MGIPLSSLSDKLGVNVAATDIFLVSNTDSTQDNKITRDEFSKAFTGFYAQNSQGLTIFETNGVYGLSVSGSNGFVGINDRTPFVSLDVIDNIASTNGSGQIRLSTPNSGRKIGFSLSDPNTYYQFSKKPNDTKLYLESSVNNGSTFTNLFVVDQSGNFALTNSTGALSDKFLVSGDSIQFQNSGNAIIFDPYNGEVKTSATDETLLINYNNIADINIGRNAIYVDNSLSAPKIGLGHNLPAYLLHLSGIGQLARFQSSNAQSYASYRNSVATSYYGMQNNKIYFGGDSSLTEKNLIYTIGGSGFLGLGTTGPSHKLDVITSDPTDSTPASFQNDNTQGYCQVIVACNKPLAGGDTGPRNSFLTLSRYDGSADIDKWSIGNIYNDTTFGGNDDFVFITNGYGGASPNVVAKLSTAGSLNIDGNYTSNDAYCKGKFVQTYQTQVTGTDIYFNPLYPNSSNNPSGNNSIASPFTIANFNGSVERVMFMTSDVAAETAGGYRFEISAISPINNEDIPNGFVSGFFVSPPSNPVTFPTSGIIAATTVAGVSTNSVIIKTKANFVGSTNFTSGQLLQYRLCNTNGTKAAAANFNVVTTIAYTIV
jgi:hypothetical protein